MTTVQIGSTEYEAYSSLVDAEEYMLAVIGSHADAWRAETSDDVKVRALVSSTRLLDRQNWQGEKTSDGQPLQWPRTGVTTDPPETNEIPQEIVDASVELAAYMLSGEFDALQQNTANAIQSAKAGSASVTYFRGAEGVSYRFPLPVQELIGKWLKGAGATRTGGVEAYDTCRETSYSSMGTVKN